MLFRMYAMIESNNHPEFGITCRFVARCNTRMKLDATISREEMLRLHDRNDITLLELEELIKQSPYTVHKCKTK